MARAFDDEREFRQQKPSDDTEFTLGAGTLLLILTGLLVVCSICFGLGYMYGTRRIATQIPDQQSITTAGVPANGLQQKPSASAQAPVTEPQQTPQADGASQPAASDQPQSMTAVAVPVSVGQTAVQPSLVAVQPQVHPALPTANPAPQPPAAKPVHPVSSLPQPQSQPQPQQQAQPAAQPAPSAPTLWVQIAAVSHDEDAAVLTEALKKRGYSVTNRRQSDNLVHVRIGPFNSRDEASRWRAKLLDDGYNAEVQQ